jgi:hypothetical protein
MTKAKQIRACKEANPTHKAKDIAKACGVTTTYVYQVLHNAKKRTIKAIKSMDFSKTKKSTPNDGQKVLREEMDRLHAEIANLQIMDEVNERLLADYESEIEQLKSDIIGYRAVISYLQGQLDGATV